MILGVNQRFGRLLIEEIVVPQSHRHRTIRCRGVDASKIMRADNLTSGNTTSCGCTRTSSKSHGHCVKSADGRRASSTYSIWRQMIARCTNRKNKKYPRYGGRGIVVCARWLTSFEAFIADMGERPSGMTIDRKDNDGNYEMSNCRWATWSAQRRNRDDVKLESHEPGQIRWLFGLGYSGKSIAAFFDLNQGTVSKIKLGRIYQEEAVS